MSFCQAELTNSYVCSSLPVLYHEILDRGMKESDLFLNSQLFDTDPPNIHNHFSLGQGIGLLVPDEGYIQKSDSSVS